MSLAYVHRLTCMCMHVYTGTWLGVLGSLIDCSGPHDVHEILSRGQSRDALPHKNLPHKESRGKSPPLPTFQALLSALCPLPSSTTSSPARPSLHHAGCSHWLSWTLRPGGYFPYRLKDKRKPILCVTLGRARPLSGFSLSSAYWRDCCEGWEL